MKRIKISTSNEQIYLELNKLHYCNNISLPNTKGIRMIIKNINRGETIVNTVLHKKNIIISKRTQSYPVNIYRISK